MNTVFGDFGLFLKAERSLFLVVWGVLKKKKKHYIKLSVIHSHLLSYSDMVLFK